jgi:hypothetical protein
VHDKVAAQFDLRSAGRFAVEQVQNVELTGTEIPLGKEDATGVPEGLGRTQQLNERDISRPRRNTGNRLIQIHEATVYI